MLSIRFFRTGKTNQPFFRIVVTDRRNAPRGGRFLEVVGFYNPITKEKQLKKERIEHWLGVGAQPSDTVRNLLIKEGVLTGEKVAVHKKPKKKALEAKAKAQASASPLPLRATAGEAEAAKVQAEQVIAEEAPLAKPATEAPKTEEPAIEAKEEASPQETPEFPAAE